MNRMINKILVGLIYVSFALTGIIFLVGAFETLYYYNTGNWLIPSVEDFEWINIGIAVMFIGCWFLMEQFLTVFFDEVPLGFRLPLVLLLIPIGFGFSIIYIIVYPIPKLRYFMRNFWNKNL